MNLRRIGAAPLCGNAFRRRIDRQCGKAGQNRRGTEHGQCCRWRLGPLRRVARIGRYGDFDLMFAAAR